MSDYALQAEAEMWEAIASQPEPRRERCDRCGRDLAGGLPSPCPRCAVRRAELDAELEKPRAGQPVLGIGQRVWAGRRRPAG